MCQKSNQTLSATDLANAWYIGKRVKCHIENTRGLMRALRAKGLNKQQRKEVVRNAS